LKEGWLKDSISASILNGLLLQKLLFSCKNYSAMKVKSPRISTEQETGRLYDLRHESF